MFRPNFWSLLSVNDNIMSNSVEKKVILVVRKTRLDELISRFLTLSQARFYVESLGHDFSDYEQEHKYYRIAKSCIVEYLHSLGRFQILEREYLTNFVFGPEDLVIALGQDGMVANIMKYLHGQPLLGINPDAGRFDGVLLPFKPLDLPKIIPEVLRGQRKTRKVTMALAELNDGQQLYAVNDLFIGPKNHGSARYALHFDGYSENQSSSGIIVSTGLGSTGWMKSIMTGAFGIATSLDDANRSQYKGFAWNRRELLFAVREPFPSIASKTELLFGEITPDKPLEVVSHMPQNGVIFSDGIETDNLEFNIGSIAKIGVAAREGCLVV